MNGQTDAIVRLVGAILALVLAWMIGVSIVRGGVLSALRAHAREERERLLSRTSSSPTTPQRYKVDGTDKATGLGTTWYCMALTAQEANTKAVAQGITVKTVVPA